MKKNSKKDNMNLFFSAFLVSAYIVCAHFFSNFAATLSSTAGLIINAIIFAVFGLLLFYATRVGDGKAVVRFSPLTLIFMVIPSLYIIIASVAAGLPLHSSFVSSDGSSFGVITILACMVLGYGVPYTFVSGFELNDGQDSEEDGRLLEGGIEADIAENLAEGLDAPDEVEETVEEETWRQDDDTVETEGTAETEDTVETEPEKEEDSGKVEE